MIVNIIGRGEGWELGLDAEGEIWSINYWSPQTTILFNIHPKDHEYYTKNAREIANANAACCRVITQDDLDIALLVHDTGTDYFGSSTDWLIALAILEGAKEIHLWGVIHNDRGDHYEKRCATDFWCGVAMGRGIKVVVHGNSTVMTTSDGLTYGTFTPMKRQFKQI